MGRVSYTLGVFKLSSNAVPNGCRLLDEKRAVGQAFPTRYIYPR
jgi:hypothetical protein